MCVWHDLVPAGREEGKWGLQAGASKCSWGGICQPTQQAQRQGRVPGAA